MTDLVKDHKNNPEVKIYGLKNNHIILDQVRILERNIRLLKSALNGNTEQCVDVDCEGGSGEGSGEGDDGSSEGSGEVQPTDSTIGSGSGEIVKPTESSCANSVNENCVETIVPKTIDNNIPFVPINNEDMVAQSRQGKSNINTGSLLLLLLCFWMAVVLWIH